MGGFETKKPPVGGFTTLLIALIILFFPMVPGVGLEPTQRERRGILNPLCLPIPPSGLGIEIGGAFRSRTGLDGFAIRYITALLTRRNLLALQPTSAIADVLNLERETRLELATPTLARSCSTN